MSSGIYIALSGAVAAGNAVDVTAGNVANAGTAGFRANRATFRQALTAAGAQDATFVTAGGTNTDETPGPIEQTGNPLDLAIEGDGMFAVDTPRGVRYSRNGAFRLDSAGTIVNAEGLAVRSESGAPLVVPPNSANVTISPDGAVRADDAEIGSIAVARFASGSLVREGGGLFAAQGGSAPLAGEKPSVLPGALEQSNINIVRGMVDMVRWSRNYETLHRMIETNKELDDRIARSGG